MLKTLLASLRVVLALSAGGLQAAFRPLVRRSWLLRGRPAVCLPRLRLLQSRLRLRLPGLPGPLLLPGRHPVFLPVRLWLRRSAFTGDTTGFGAGYGYGYGDGYGYGGYPYGDGAYNGSIADANGYGGHATRRRTGNPAARCRKRCKANWPSAATTRVRWTASSVRRAKQCAAAFSEEAGDQGNRQLIDEPTSGRPSASRTAADFRRRKVSTVWGREHRCFGGRDP